MFSSMVLKELISSIKILITYSYSLNTEQNSLAVKAIEVKSICVVLLILHRVNFVRVYKNVLPWMINSVKL